MKVYFDNNASTPLLPGLRERMLEWMDIYGNPHSIHQWGRQARNLVDAARDHLSQLLNCGSEEIIFTSGATESINAVFRSVFVNPQQSRNECIVSVVEHAAILANAEYLKKQGFIVKYLPVDAQGNFDLHLLKELLSDKTALLAVMHANNEIGNVYPVQAMAEIAHQHGVLMLSDTTQSLGKISVNLKELAVDFAVGSAHKFHGPKGVGFLYLNKKIPFQPLLLGGSQENYRRGGTLNVSGILGLVMAYDYCAKNILQMQSSLKKLKEYFLTQMQKLNGMKIFGDQNNTLHNTISLGIAGKDGQTLVMNLDLQGIAVSYGAACESGSMESSHVIDAMGYEEAIAKTVIRISFSSFNTEAEVDYFMKTLQNIVVSTSKQL